MAFPLTDTVQDADTATVCRRQSQLCHHQLGQRPGSRPGTQSFPFGELQSAMDLIKARLTKFLTMLKCWVKLRQLRKRVFSGHLGSHPAKMTVLLHRLSHLKKPKRLSHLPPLLQTRLHPLLFLTFSKCQRLRCGHCIGRLAFSFFGATCLARHFI